MLKNNEKAFHYVMKGGEIFGYKKHRNQGATALFKAFRRTDKIPTSKRQSRLLLPLI